MEPFEKAFDQLRREYLAESDARITELRADVDSLRMGDQAAVLSLRTRFHRLVGSGGSYGFPEISTAARESERWVASETPPGPADADALDDAVDRLAVLFSDATARFRRDSPIEGEARLAVLSASAGDATDELRNALTSAGFTVCVVPPAAKPGEVAGSETAELVVLSAEVAGTIEAAAAWAASDSDMGRAVLLIETGTPVNRLHAAVAGVEEVFPAERAVTDLSRFAQRYVRVSGRRRVVVVADHDERRAGIVAEALGEVMIEVRRAGSAEEACEHLDGDVPDLVLAATTLPGGGGRALARLVRQDARAAGLPVVLIGDMTAMERVAALREGADDVVASADDAGALAAVLRARAERGRRIRELVRRDPLTGVLNHTALMAELDHASARTRREGGTFAFMLAELEHFRRINDRHGRLTGDRLLAHAASVLRGTVRASDPIGRHAGRAFAVVLRGATPEGAARIAAKVHAAFADHPYETRDGGTIPLKARVGHAVHGADGVTAEDLIHAADRRVEREE